MRCIGVGNNYVSRQHLPGGKPHTGHATAFDNDSVDVRAKAKLDRSFEAARISRVGQPTKTSSDVPSTERLLDVRHNGQRGWSPSRIGTRVGRIAVEDHAQAWIAQMLPSFGPQRPPGSDQSQVSQSKRLP